MTILKKIDVQDVIECSLFNFSSSFLIYLKQ